VPLYIGDDMVAAWTGAHYVDSAGATQYLNAATVTYTLRDSALAAVASATGTLAYVSASNGNYRATVESTVTELLTEGATYYLDFVLSQSSYNGRRRLKLRAEYRGED
jgi:hypothetical protein